MSRISPPSDAALASLCALIYKPAAIVDSFDHFDAGLDDGVCWAFKRLDGFDVIVFRGSVTLQDWIADFRAMAMPTRIGHVHLGFHAGMENVWVEARPYLTQPVIVTGHSLGAARADVLCGLMVADGKPPIARVVFGEPKPGLMDFALHIENVPGRSYRNGDGQHHDLVADVPFSFPPLQYVHPTPIIPVCCPPQGDDFASWGAFAYHHIELYETALAVLEALVKAA
jgi:Lipase (class 3)